MKSCGNLLCQGHGLVSYVFYHHSDKFQASLVWHWWPHMTWPCFLSNFILSPPTWTLNPWPPSRYCFLSSWHLQAFVPQFCLRIAHLDIIPLFNSSLPFRTQFLGKLLGKAFPDSSRGYHISCPSRLPEFPAMTHHSTSWTILPK